MSALLLALLALQAPLDEGTLLVRQDTAEIGREAFRLSGARGGSGWTLASTVRYDRNRPIVVLNPILEIGADSLPASLEFSVADPRDPLRILGQLARGRFTVRLLGRRTERAREFPASGHVVVLDDSVFALYLLAAWHAGPSPVPVTAIFARSGRRELLVVQDQGVEATTVNRDPASLHHVTVRGGANQLVHLWLDRAGRLLKVEVPASRLTAERAPAS
ncbi:MAG TPA: hypothetical protein VEK85_14550 [Gemmatimonadales bacterium]|nr:hypothetical protein [Gemmatimonadales bacterium]